MTQYLVIQTRDRFGADSGSTGGLAQNLADNGDDVTVFLAQNAVLSSRAAAGRAAPVRALVENARVMVDDFSLAERGIGRDELVGGVEVAQMSDAVEVMTTPGCRAIWQ